MIFRKNLNQDFDLKKPLKIYRNLNSYDKKLFSILAYSDTKRGYRLYAHANNFITKNNSTKINEIGRLKVIKNKSRNVHAYIICDELLDNDQKVYKKEEITYNPYKFSTFYFKESQKPFTKSDHLLFLDGKLHVININI